MKKFILLLALALVGLTKNATATKLESFVIKKTSDTTIKVTLVYSGCTGDGREIIVFIDPGRTMIQEHRAFIPTEGTNTQIFSDLNPGVNYSFTVEKDLPGLLGTCRTSGAPTILVGFRGELIEQNLNTLFFVNSATAPDVNIIVKNGNTINDVLKFPASAIKANSVNKLSIPIGKYLNEKKLTIQAFASYGAGDTFSTEILTFLMPGSIGINPIEKSLFEVYPNPLNSNSSDMLNIYSPFAGELSILNLKGQKVYNSSVEFGRNAFVADLPKGVYFLKIINPSNATVSKKLLIQ